MKLDLQKANNELQTNTYEQLQTSVAWAWASRAAASYLRSINAKQIEQKLTWLEYGTIYYEEAIEHASISIKLIQEIQKELNNFKVKAKDEIKKYKVGDN